MIILHGLKGLGRTHLAELDYTSLTEEVLARMSDFSRPWQVHRDRPLRVGMASKPGA